MLSHQCPDSACKQDLLAYLQRIALYCHQLNICSKVKAEVQNLGGELVVSGVSFIYEKKWLVSLLAFVQNESSLLSALGKCAEENSPEGSSLSLEAKSYVLAAPRVVTESLDRAGLLLATRWEKVFLSSLISP